MKNKTKLTIIFSVTILLALSIVGCDEEQQLPSSKQQTPSPKRARLIADENMMLKGQIQNKDTQIKDLRTQLQTQNNLLETCKEENKSLKMQKQKEGEAFMLQVLMSADTEKQELKKQVETLKQKIKELEAK